MHRNTVSAVTARWNYEEGVRITGIPKECNDRNARFLHEMLIFI